MVKYSEIRISGRNYYSCSLCSSEVVFDRKSRLENHIKKKHFQSPEVTNEHTNHNWSLNESTFEGEQIVNKIMAQVSDYILLTTKQKVKNILKLSRHNDEWTIQKIIEDIKEAQSKVILFNIFPNWSTIINHQIKEHDANKQNYHQSTFKRIRKTLKFLKTVKKNEIENPLALFEKITKESPNQRKGLAKIYNQIIQSYNLPFRQLPTESNFCVRYLNKTATCKKCQNNLDFRILPCQCRILCNCEQNNHKCSQKIATNRWITKINVFPNQGFTSKLRLQKARLLSIPVQQNQQKWQIRGRLRQFRPLYEKCYENMYIMANLPSFTEKTSTIILDSMRKDQKYMPLKIKYKDSTQLGVFSLADLQEGTLICTYVGQIVSFRDCKQTDNSIFELGYLTDKNENATDLLCIRCRTHANLGRFLNTSNAKEPANCKPEIGLVHTSEGFQIAVVIYSVQKIKEGEQLIYSYGTTYEKQF